MSMKWAITTNKTTFFHFCKTKKEAREMADQVVAKFAVNFGDTVIKIKKVWF